MKLLFASDIHGDEYWCSRMVDEYKNSGADRLVLLGDILYHGPRNSIPDHYNPRGVIALLNPLKDRILCVRGNCDTEVDQMVLEFPIMSEYSQILTPLHTFYLTHGHYASMEHLPPLAFGDVFVQGHTHIPVLEKRDGRILLNPGSVSLPKNNTPHSFCLFQEKQSSCSFQLKDFEGNVFREL